MFSSRLRLSRPAAWSLRQRMLIGLLALFAALCVCVGTITTVLLSRFLLDQLDGQLVAAQGRFAGSYPPAEDSAGRGPPGPPPRRSPRLRRPPRPPPPPPPPPPPRPPRPPPPPPP